LADDKISVQTSNGGQFEIQRVNESVSITFIQPDEYGAISLYDNIVNTLQSSGQMVLSLKVALPQQS
jgi:hypothetical protein